MELGKGSEAKYIPEAIIVTIVPAFQIGVWNSWILMLAFVVFRVTLGGRVPYKTEGGINVLINGILWLLFMYSVFLPLTLGSAWFYTGLVVFLLGTAVFWIAGLSWATTSPDEPVTKGPYRYSRHPFYFAMLVQIIGIGIASASWIFLLSSVPLLLLMNRLVLSEEAFCLETYGNAYHEYIRRTPRWIGIPKSH